MTESTFDPYRVWLGIPTEQQPPTRYRLLGLVEFERDPEVISHAADRCMAHVRKLATADRSGASQRILNELSEARGCLLDPVRKAAYDKRLRSEQGLTAAPPVATLTSSPAPVAVPIAASPVATPVAAVPVAPPVEPERESTVADEPIFPSTSSSSSVRRRTRRKKSSPVPMLVFGALACLALGGILIALASSKSDQGDGHRPAAKKKQTRRVIVRTTKPATSKKPQIRTPKSPTRPVATVAPATSTAPEASEPSEEPEEEFIPGEAPVAFVVEGKLSAALAKVRGAMQDGELAQARVHLAEAAEVASSEKHRARIERVRTLIGYMDTFYQALLSSVQTLESGTILVKNPNQQIKFLRYETEPVPTVVIEDDGDEVKIPLNALPPVIAWRLAVFKLPGGDSNTNLYVATYLSMGPVNEFRRGYYAREMWIEALRQGQVDMALIDEVDLPYDIVLPERSSTPVAPRE